jgi:hypothetical protein
VAWAVTAALSVVVSATCITWNMTPEQKACCAAMHHDCGTAGIERNCCSGEAGKLKSLAPAALSPLKCAPVAVLLAVLEPPLVMARATQRLNTPNGLTVKPPGAPTYLLIAAFRI